MTSMCLRGDECRCVVEQTSRRLWPAVIRYHAAMQFLEGEGPSLGQPQRPWGRSARSAGPRNERYAWALVILEVPVVMRSYSKRARGRGFSGARMGHLALSVSLQGSSADLRHNLNQASIRTSPRSRPSPTPHTHHPSPKVSRDAEHRLCMRHDSSKPLPFAQPPPRC
jgi:hypothetical protein